VKTYVRSAYRKIGVTTRTQAVLWGLSNGFNPDTERIIDPALRRRPPAPASLARPGRSTGRSLLASELAPAG